MSFLPGWLVTMRNVELYEKELLVRSLDFSGQDFVLTFADVASLIIHCFGRHLLIGTGLNSSNLEISQKSHKVACLYNSAGCD